MISPKECATQFNTLIRKASDSSVDFQNRLYTWHEVQVFYYVLTGTSLKLNLDEYFSNYGISFDYSNFSELEVDNTTGERKLKPIRRFINMLFPKY